MSSLPTSVPTSTACGFQATDRRSSPEYPSSTASCQRELSPEMRWFSERHVLAVQKHCSIVSLACSSVLRTISFIRFGLISSFANTNSLFYTATVRYLSQFSVMLLGVAFHCIDQLTKRNPASTHFRSIWFCAPASRAREAVARELCTLHIPRLFDGSEVQYDPVLLSGMQGQRLAIGVGGPCRQSHSGGGEGDDIAFAIELYDVEV